MELPAAIETHSENKNVPVEIIYLEKAMYVSLLQLGLHGHLLFGALGVSYAFALCVP